MARSKKTKTTEQDTVAAEPQEFNYDESEDLYRQVMTGQSHSTSGPEVGDDTVAGLAEAPPESVSYAQSQSSPEPAPIPTVAARSTSFLVEGKVRLDQGGNSTFADQRRIVVATSVDEALEKFVNYFAKMSGPEAKYTVVQAGASEAIL